jgi:hypothetical protein
MVRRPTRRRRSGLASFGAMRVNRIGVRNALIIAAIAAVGVVWQRGFDAIAVSAGQVLTVLFVAAMISFGYSYFRQNQLAWLVLKLWQRVVIVVAALGIAFLLIAGFPLLGDRLTTLGVVALIAVLGLVIVWIIRESRRFP